MTHLCNRSSPDQSDQPDPISIEFATRHLDAECLFNADLARFQAGVQPIPELSLPAVVEAAKAAFRLGFSYVIRQDSECMEVCVRHSAGAEEISSAASDTLHSPALLLAGLLGIPVGVIAQSSESEQHTDDAEIAQPEPIKAIDPVEVAEAPALEAAAAIAVAVAVETEEPDLMGPDSPAGIPGDHPSLRLLAPEEIEAAVGLIKVMTAASRKSFTIAFRNAFEVPDSVMRIAGEITQLRHLQFIDTFNLESADEISS
jgi:hypothetical protein